MNAHLFWLTVMSVFCSSATISHPAKCCFRQAAYSDFGRAFSLLPFLFVLGPFHGFYVSVFDTRSLLKSQ